MATEKLVELLDETFSHQYDKNLCITARITANFLIDNGATIPVRCKNCAWSQQGDGVYYCINPDGLDNYAKPDDFCSYGEQRTEDESCYEID